MNKVTLEESRNPHVLEVVNGTIDLVEITPNVSYVRVIENRTGTQTKRQVIHNEHDTLALESNFVVKSIQQEYNPVTKAFQKAFDQQVLIVLTKGISLITGPFYNLNMKYVKEKDSYDSWFGYYKKKYIEHGIWVQTNWGNKLLYNIEKENTTVYMVAKTKIRLYL